jgi:hypothetical protein
MTPLDFFFWVKVKNDVYSEKIRDLNHLRARLIATVNAITPEMLANTWEEVKYRLDLCRATNGAHIELY